jgi:mannose-6-phosphate isomerase-like protein (cupin superfamily)
VGRVIAEALGLDQRQQPGAHGDTIRDLALERGAHLECPRSCRATAIREREELRAPVGGIGAPLDAHDENRQVRPGSASPEHALTHEEVFVALSGRAVATLDGVPYAVGPGDALLAGPDLPFVLANEGDEPFEAVVAMRCGGLAQVGGERFAPPWAE